MKRKPIKIDWDDLDEAFHRKDAEVGSYLDLVTGHVVLEGEGEDDDLDDDESSYAAPRAPDVAPSPVDDATRLYVHPARTPEKIVWLKEFLADKREAYGEIVDRLAEAMGAEEPARAIGDILNQNPEVRDEWYVYRADRVHERIERWLADHDVQSVDDPPWK